jgi:multiple sugar transport system permease protein
VHLFGITMPMVYMTIPFAVFFLRQFFLNISREVEEAALIDAAGRSRVFPVTDHVADINAILIPAM